MDKETLSNYGWIVIAVLVLSVMLALATPFGGYIKNATLSTLNGFFDTNDKALEAIGLKNDENDEPNKEMQLGCNKLYWDGDATGLTHTNNDFYNFYKISDTYDVGNVSNVVANNYGIYENYKDFLYTQTYGNITAVWTGDYVYLVFIVKEDNKHCPEYPIHKAP